MNLQTRLINILTKPKEEWPVIASETTDVRTLYSEYIVLLAAVPPICTFLGMTLIGVPVPFLGRMRTGVISGISNVIVTYVLTLVGVYGAAFIIAKLAPTFQSSTGLVQALKLVAYASTPGWVAGVLNLLPSLVVLSILAGLYGIYLFYLGLPPVMKTPPNKVVPYMAVSAIVILVIYLIIGSVSAAFTGAFLRF